MLIKYKNIMNNDNNPSKRTEFVPDEKCINRNTLCIKMIFSLYASIIFLMLGIIIAETNIIGILLLLLGIICSIFGCAYSIKLFISRKQTSNVKIIQISKKVKVISWILIGFPIGFFAFLASPAWARVLYIIIVICYLSNIKLLEKRAQTNQEQGGYLVRNTINDYSNLIKLTNNPKYYFQRAVLYAEQYDIDNAISDCTMAISLDSNIAEYYALRAKLYLQNHELNNSLDDCTKLINLEPNNPDYYIKRAQAYKKDKSGQLNAIQDCSEAIRLNPTETDYYIARASYYYRIKEFDKAIADYSTIIRITPSENNYILRATFYEENLLDFNKAINDYAEAIKINPENGYCYSRMADCYQRLDKLQEAITNYTKAIKYKHNSYLLRAKCYEYAGNYRNAISDYKKCLNGDDKFFVVGKLYEQLKEYDYAVENFKEALHLSPNNTTYKNALKRSMIKIQEQTQITNAPSKNKSVTKQRTSKKQNKIYTGLVKLLTCTLDQLLSLEGFDNNKATKFIKERNSGKMWYDIDSFVRDFDIQPHEMIQIQDRIIFPPKANNKIGRKIDI